MTQKIASIDRKPTSEKQERDTALIERFTLVSDGDGHEYVIPLYLKTEFDTWNEMDAESEEFNSNQFNEYMLGGGLLTFTDPKIN